MDTDGKLKNGETLSNFNTEIFRIFFINEKKKLIRKKLLCSNLKETLKTFKSYDFFREEFNM
jgi:hypothetical protein